MSLATQTNSVVRATGLNRSSPSVWIIIGAAFLFILLGALLIPRAGFEVDELLFTNPLYSSLSSDFELGVLHHKVPVMLIAYVGAFKTLLYWPILHVFGPSAFTIRLPMVLAGAATILLFFRLADTLAGRVAAVIAVVLLATDPTFLLTDTFDWGRWHWNTYCWWAVAWRWYPAARVSHVFYLGSRYGTRRHSSGRSRDWRRARSSRIGPSSAAAFGIAGW